MTKRILNPNSWRVRVYDFVKESSAYVVVFGGVFLAGGALYMGFTQKPNPYDELVQQCMQIMRKDDRVSRMFQDYQMDTHVHIKSLDPLEIQFRIQNDRKQGVVEARYKQDKDSRILQKLSISDGTKTMTLFDRNPPTHPRKWFQLGFF